MEVTVLDDLKLIHERDAQDTLGIVAGQSSQLAQVFETGVTDMTGITNIIYAGMGGSALAAAMTYVWPGYRLPLQIVQGYDLPAYVSAQTLCIVASYSGNTEEMLSALGQAEAAGARMAVITGGGRLADIARQKQYPLALLPKVIEPRYAVLSNVKALLDTTVELQAMDAAMVHEELQAAAALIDTAIENWKPEVPTARNLAKQIARELMGRTVIIYSGPQLAPVVQKWKMNFNENARQLAWTGQLPEFNHNEFIGWTGQPLEKQIAVINLRSNLEHLRVSKRFDLSARLLSGKRPEAIEIQAEGDTIMQQLAWTAALGDYVSIYLGLLNGINPAPLPLVDTFKKEMEQS